MCKYTKEDFDNPAVRDTLTVREFSACDVPFSTADLVARGLSINDPKPPLDFGGGAAAIVVVIGLVGLGWLAKHMFSTLKKA